jgi:hypothetical protein
MTHNIVDIGDDVYYLGPQTGPALATIHDRNESALKNKVRSYHIIQDKNTFQKNYNALPIDRAIHLATTYFKTGESNDILAGVGKSLMSETDRTDLITMLEARATELDKAPSRYIVNHIPHNIADNIRKLILNIRHISLYKNTSTTTVSLTQEDILKQLVRMAWFLLYPKKVPSDISSSWSSVIATIKNTNMDDIITATQTLKDTQTQFTDTYPSFKDNDELKKRLIAFLTLLEGVKEVKAAENNGTTNDAIKGGSYLTIPPTFIATVMNPIIEYIHHIYPVYSLLDTIAPALSHDLIIPLQRLVHLCHGMTHHHYGFYRINGAPRELVSYIEHHIQHMKQEKHHSNQDEYHYFLSLRGNISYTTVTNTKKQKAECKAVRSYITPNTLYILYTNKKGIDMRGYLDDPYYAYDISYHAINDGTNTVPIRQVDSLLNEESIELSRYLTSYSAHAFVATLLDCSVFHFLNRLCIL